MFEKNMNHNNDNIFKKTPYVSCIKINGVPILAPLITTERRKELLKYKKQAIKLEQRLKNCRELRKNLDELLSTRPLSGRSQGISFKGDSHIEALEIEPSKVEKYRKLSLSRDIVDVSQYSSEGIKVIYAESEDQAAEENVLNTSNETTNDVESIEASFGEQMKILDSKSEHCPILDLTLVDENQSKVIQEKGFEETQSTPKPRLIRSNSYILETPSPILLANMNRLGPSTENTNYPFTRNWSSMENNYVPFESSDFSSINTVLSNENKSKSSSSTPKEEIKLTSEVKSPTIEVFQTDISVQQVTVNTFDKNEENATVLSQNAIDVNDPNDQLMEILKKIPDDYSSQIIEIIKHQKLEQQHRLQRYDKIAEMTSNPSKIAKSDAGQNSLDKLRRSSTFSVSPSQSIYYSVNNSSVDTLTPTPSVKLIDLDSDFEISERSNGANRQDSYEDKINEDIKNHNVSRELFDKLDPATLNKLKREWAASVIGAHVKGYLTRRLLKTERVQSLIDTIRDALVCALELHNSDTIDEADVELHRRLLQQVSAACYTFHDIFFELSVKEQMQTISVDRQHKIEKAKRPLSATSSKRSLTSSQSSSNGIRASRHSLTNF